MSYVNVRAANDAHTQNTRSRCEQLWKIFEPYADPEFLIEIRSNFDARYWEMYLTVFLIREGYEVCAPKPGPDVGIRYNGCRIWFEATCPERGAETNPDQVPDMKPTAFGQELIFRDVPNEKILLRYLNAISEKRRQHASWLASGVVVPEDALVIAINPRRLQHEIVDGDPPRIIQAAYAVGPPYIALDPTSGEAVEVGYQFRNAIKKHTGAEVPSGVFLLSDYNGLSGLLCSRVDAANQPEKMGADFQLVENRWASAPMPDLFRLKGTFFRTERRNEIYVIASEMHT